MNKRIIFMLKTSLVLLAILVFLSGCTNVDLNEGFSGLTGQETDSTNAEPVHDSNKIFATGDNVKNYAVQNQNKIITATIDVIQTDYSGNDFIQSHLGNIQTGTLLFNEATVVYRGQGEDVLWIPGTEENYVVYIPIVKNNDNLVVMDGCKVTTHQNLQHQCDLEIEYCDPEWVTVPTIPPSVKYIIDENGVYHFGGIEYPCFQ